MTCSPLPEYRVPCRARRGLVFRRLPMIAVLTLVLLTLAPPGAWAQYDAVPRPPGNIPRPPANVGGSASAANRDAGRDAGGPFLGLWNPFAPLFRPSAPPPPPPSVVQPAIKTPPVEPEGQVYASADEAVAGRKQPPLAFVLVMGDRVATQLAKGLADGYVGDKGAPAVIGRTDEDSGFLRGETAQVVDWVAKWPDAFAAARPGAVILALGSNDLRPIRDGEAYAEPLTERWSDLYTRRLADLLAAMRKRTPNIILMGLPPVQNPATSADYEKLNELLKSHAAKAGVTFVSVWDGFVDEDGKYVPYGAAVDGQRRRLRLNDGVRFTRAGARKLAFFVQKDLTRLLADYDRQAQEARDLSGQSGKLRGANQLAGGSAPVPVSTTPSQAMKVLREGLPLAAPAGRADDFTWPPGGRMP